MNAWELVIASICYLSAACRLYEHGNEWAAGMLAFYAAANGCWIMSLNR